MKNNITLLVLKKELLDIFRDKKTVIVSILIPLIVFPVMFMFMGKSMDKTTKSVEENLKIYIKDEGNSSLGQFIKQQKGINIQDSTDITSDVKNGKISVAIEIPGSFEKDLSEEKTSNIILTYDNSSQQSQMAIGKIEGLISAFSKQIVTQRLEKRNIEQNLLNPINIEHKTAEKESEGFGKFMLSLLLPLLLVVYSVTGPMAPAIDLGAGEKERGTLEPLLTTQASRMALLWGKFFAITVMGLLTTLASITGVLISMRQNGGFFSQGGAQGAAPALYIEVKALILIGLIAIMTTMVFGALELAVSIYARSFKESQTYLTPLTIIAIIPVYATYMLDAKNIESFYFHIPLANAACVLKELVSGIYNTQHILITIGWTIVYIILSIMFARFMFSREEVIFRT